MSIENKAQTYLGTGSLLGDFLDNFQAYIHAASAAFGIKGTTTHSIVSESQPIEVLEQNLTLNVTTLASARRAAKLMMPHLAPMPIGNLVWDVVGPNGEDVNGKYSYTLGFVRLDDLDRLSGKAHGIKTKNGNTYSFMSDTHLITKRKNFLFKILGLAACYCALLWMGFEWSERPSNITQNWQAEIRQLRSDTSNLQTESQALATQSALMGVYQKGSQSFNILNILSAASQTLPDAGWIRQLNSTEQQIRINGLTDDATKFATLLEAKPSIARVELGVVSTDRTTGLQRFVLTVFLVEA